MKRKITQLLVLAMVFSATTFAANINNNVSKSIQTAFTTKFAGATDISWSSSDKYTKASFQYKGQFMAAYYAKSGELLGVGRNLVSTQLPINLQTEIKRKLNGEWISDLFEYSTDEESAYYITIEDADEKQLLKSSDNYTWVLIKKARKN